MPLPNGDGLRAMEIGTPGPMRQRLNGLVLSGVKRATAGLLVDYGREGEPLEAVGERMTLVDDDGRGLATIVVNRVETCAFGEVPWKFAAAEGEGDESIEQWREGHLGYWSGEGEVVNADTPIMLVWFELDA